MRCEDAWDVITVGAFDRAGLNFCRALLGR
jgi:hypothetical protein